MTKGDLAIFETMPVMFWIKDVHGVYKHANQVLSAHAGFDVVGKSEHEMPWAPCADELLAHDRQVFETGEPLHVPEHVLKYDPPGESFTVNSCKWLDQYEGETCCFGLSFVFDQE